jgi:hypothetical protein
LRFDLWALSFSFPAMPAFARRHPVLTTLAALLLFLAAAAFVWVRVRMHGPYRAYRVDTAFTSAPAAATNAPLLAGVAVRDITPDLAQFDPWQDVDGNSKFEPDKGDTWEDRNGNGAFDFVWLGGFDMNRPAQGVNDPLWARALAFRHGGVTVALVSIDCVGLTHERFIKARKLLEARGVRPDYVLFSSTHTHNSPDTMGIWSYRPLFSKFSEAYVDHILAQACDAVAEAVAKLAPVEATLAAVDLPPEGFVRDSRPPLVYDRQLHAVRLTRAGTDETVATLVSWGNHPEAMGGKNPLLSSDFPHYLREAMEQGLPAPNGMAGFGAPCVFLQGPVGGLMTPLGLHVPDRNGQFVHTENGVGKTRALGENVALRAAAALRGPAARRMTNLVIAGVAKTVFAPIEGPYKYPLMLGLIHPGWYDGKAKTEVAALSIGEIEILSIPGEIYPEIVDGGIESPAGADFPGAPREVPPLRSRMRGTLNLVANLANDEIGYLVPHTQWDVQPPHTYGLKDAPYGEVNSGGPEVAPLIHREALAMLEQLHGMTGE